MQKIRKILAFVAVGLIIPSTCYAWWIITYGGSGDESAHSIRQTSDGGYIVAGYTRSFGAGDQDLWVLKLNSDGTVAWQKTYGGSADDRASSIQQTSDGGYVVAGGAASFGLVGEVDVWALKLNSDGTIAWQKTYGGSGWDEANSIQQTSDGGYVVAGSTGSLGAGAADLWVLKLNPDGTIAWQKTYGGSADDRARSIQQTCDGGYIVAGESNSFEEYNRDIWVLKLHSDGTIAWQKTYGGSVWENLNSIQETSDGGYIVAGTTGSFNIIAEAWVLKLNSDGTIAWQKTYGGSEAYSIQQTSDGGYILAVQKGFFDAGNSEVRALKLNSDGSIDWLKTYGDDNRADSAYSVQQTSDGGYVMAGATKSFGVVDIDAWVLNLKTNGEIPDCDAIGTGDATISDTSAVVRDTSAPAAVSTAVSADTAVSPQDTLAERTVVCLYTPPTYDATGMWIYSTTNNWVNPGTAGCLPDEDRTGTLSITQAEEKVTMVDDYGHTWTGTVTGPDYTVSKSYPEEGGTTTVTANFTLSSSKSGSGTGVWDWTDGIFSCNGGSDLTLTKFPVCCAKPTLETPSGEQPTYQWSCGDGEWSWFWVYVLNLYTGASYGSGWVNSSDSSWAQPSPLPWGNYRVWVRIYHPLCGYSEWSNPQDFTVGDCCAKPTLDPPSGDPTTFQWDCASGQWTYFYVYVQSLSTGAVYGSGWVHTDTSKNTWTQSLPWGNYRAWVQVYHESCGFSEWSDPQDFTVGNCCGKPGLQTPSGEQPTYQWSCAGGEWEWFYVYVQNLSTGALYGSGWVNDSANTWASPHVLPWGSYRAWVQVYHLQCGFSDWSDPQDWTVGTCCPKPDLSVNVTDTAPTYSWSCGDGEWTWFFVYVLNLTTGAYYGSGWVNSSANSWTPTGLPWGNYRAWVIVYHPLCGYSEWSDPVDLVTCSCCAKPELGMPSANPPRYQWSCPECSAAEWTWYWVYVLNLSTGAYYGTGSPTNGWVNSSSNFWDSTYTLPAGSYRGWVQVYHERCGFSEWSDPVDWTVGSP